MEGATYTSRTEGSLHADSTFLRNVGKYVRVYTASQPRETSTSHVCTLNPKLLLYFCYLESKYALSSQHGLLSTTYVLFFSRVKLPKREACLPRRTGFGICKTRRFYSALLGRCFYITIFFVLDFISLCL